MYVILCLLRLSGVFVGFGEGVWFVLSVLEGISRCSHSGDLAHTEKRVRESNAPLKTKGQKRCAIARVERTESLKIFDGHKLGRSGVTLGNGFW